MTTINFSLTAGEMVETAYQHLGAMGDGQVLSSARMTFGLRLLNLMIKSWQNQGLHLWKKEEFYLFLEKNTPDYYLGNQATSPAKACYREDAVLTTLTASPSISATSLSVGTTVGMTIGDYIGIVLSDNTIFWTTIATIPGTTSLTLTSGLSGASLANKNVYTFTTLIDKPMRVLDVRRVLGSVTSPSSIELSSFSHEEYYEQPNKLLSNMPLAFYYQPRKTYGQFHIWPASNTAQTYLEGTMERGLFDIDSKTDVPDFSDEWFEPIIYQLAIRLAPSLGKEDKAAKLIIPQGSAILENALAWDAELNSVNLQLSTRPY